MLRGLHIENYILIDSLDITFPEGLIIITGQTGAGKSILLGALSLLTGAKADASLISEGADSLVVEGEFDVPDSDGRVKSILEEADAEYDGGHLTIRRTVHRAGRSRCFINDCPVSAGVLGELSSSLIDIHSQHQNMQLLKGGTQLSLLDYFAEAKNLRDQCRHDWVRYKECEKQLAQSREELAKARKDADYNRAQWEQLNAADIREGELESLEEEQRSLANAEEIKSALSHSIELLDITRNLKDAGRALEKISGFMPSADALVQRLESSRIELEDICFELEKSNSSMNVSEDRLEQVEDRISTLLQLMRRHGVTSETELIALRDSLDKLVTGTADLEFQVQEAEKNFAEAQEEYTHSAQLLHEARAKASPALSAELQASIRSLELDRAVFEVRLEDAPESETGVDSCHFLFDSNGNAPSDLAKCASGGELSRIMLCIKNMMAQYTNMPTMIFDEIDTGVSGSVAHKMGRMICRMGERMQVFAITHLPQVAAKGNAHYLVDKSERDGRTISTLSLLNREERIKELARLLSAENITAEALANAKSLLEQ